jgi:2-keto-4-pentenoate hydratase/2-oxohepta-3-ene-1,7-dioic acid hydratase in catechol pathway
MLYCRFQTGDVEAYGIVEQHEVWEVAPDIFSPFERTGRSFPMGDVRFLPPCKPSKIIAIGLNYNDHIQEFGRTEVPSDPVMFLKATSALCGLNDPIVLPASVEPVDYEGELGIVIKKRGRRIPEAEAGEYILGCTCVNDVTARALQKRDGQWTRAKSFDTFAPVGPWIADGLPFQNLRVESYLNSRMVQQGHTRDMIFPVAKLVAFASSVMTLEPGDILSTGTPKGVGPLKAGDVIEVFVEGVGRLRNTVMNETFQGH